MSRVRQKTYRVPLLSSLKQPSPCIWCFREQVARWLLGLPVPAGDMLCGHRRPT